MDETHLKGLVNMAGRQRIESGIEVLQKSFVGFHLGS
jgi:hypothetical protein